MSVPPSGSCPRPTARQGFFYDEWTSPHSDWTRIEIPATRCPRIRPAFLEEERRHLTDQQFRQEYLCEFIAADFAYFDPEAVDDAFRPRRDRQLTEPVQS